VSDQPHDAPDPAEQALAQARTNTQAAHATGSSYGIALGLTQAGHALLTLRRPAEALTDFDAALRYLDLLRADGQHEQMRLLSIASLSLAPPDQQLGDLDTLEAWVRVGRAAALTSMDDTVLADEAIEQARPWVQGWRRRQLRRALDVVADQRARTSGSIEAGLRATTRAAHDHALSDQERRQAQYEHTHLLVESGQNAEAVREALTLLQQCDDSPALAARVRQVLGAALAGLGRIDDATTTLQEAFAGFVGLNDEYAMLSAAPGLASRLSDSGNYDGAIEVLTDALKAARSLRLNDQENEFVNAEIDLLSALATAFDQTGENNAAIDIFAQATALAEDAGEPVRAADARHGEAIVRIQSDDTDDAIDALSLLDSARGAYAAADLGGRVAGCNHESAALLARMASFDASAARYELALTEYEALGSVSMAGSATPDLIADAIADCQRNLAMLEGLRHTAAASAMTPPENAFLGGGHRMHFGPTATQ